MFSFFPVRHFYPDTIEEVKREVTASLSYKWTRPSTVRARFIKYLISHAKQNESGVYIGNVYSYGLVEVHNNPEIFVF